MYKESEITEKRSAKPGQKWAIKKNLNHIHWKNEKSINPGKDK